MVLKPCFNIAKTVTNLFRIKHKSIQNFNWCSIRRVNYVPNKIKGIIYRY